MTSIIHRGIPPPLVFVFVFVILVAWMTCSIQAWTLPTAAIPRQACSLRNSMPFSKLWLSQDDASEETTSSTTGASTDGTVNALEPQVFATGYSQALEMTTALHEALDMALEALPQHSQTKIIDLAFVTVSSLYDSNAKPSDVVPTLLEAAPGIQNIVGCTNGGFLSSLANLDQRHDSHVSNSNNNPFQACRPIEREGVPGVTVTLAILPDVQVQTFHIMGDDVPESSRASANDWRQALGWKDVNDNVENNNPAVMVLPSPAFQKDLDALLQGLNQHVTDQIFGAIASTVSSLSRARLFRYDATQGQNCIQTLADGCVGVILSGDIQVETSIAQGAKPVGGVYQIVKGQESTISAVALDETSTEMLGSEDDQNEDVDEEEEEENDQNLMGVQDRKAQLAKAYAKARIPKPVLAEANFLMKTLSDDDQAFMRKALLVGLDRGGPFGRTPSELVRLAEGKGHAFTVHQVASAGMKDGSITLSLGSVNVKPGQRLRFYVRESNFAKKEVRALWTGYKRRALLKSMGKEKEDPASNTFHPTACFVFPTLDRGSKFFGGKSGYESETVMEFLPTLPCLSGFFSNGVIGSLDADSSESVQRKSTSLLGSASGYVLIGSKSHRPIHVPSRPSADEEKLANEKAARKAEEERLEAEVKAMEKRIQSFEVAAAKAPRDEFGELILRRREIHSGRALTVSTVEWSVAEKSATPTSALEGFMWDKETEVDRFRERVPLSNLVSQCRLSAADPTKPKPRDWLGPVKEAAAKGSFVIIPECKRMEPGKGSLRKRYDIAKLAKEFTIAGAPAISVNCDGILFGGSLEDVTKAREGSSKAALEQNDSASEDGVVVPPILASDLLLYPYQLYKLWLAGADAVNIIVAALEAKDLIYLAKIASSLQMQVFVTVTSAKQIANLAILPKGSIHGLLVSNRNLEDFSFDMTGQQALDILESQEFKDFRGKHGKENIVVLAEGRVGIIGSIGNGESVAKSPEGYIEKLQNAGADGAVMGEGLVSGEGRKSYVEWSRQTTSS